jgi:hypothetical protein
MSEVLGLDALQFGLVAGRRVLRRPQQYQLKRFKVHRSFWHPGVRGLPAPALQRVTSMP